MVGGGSLTPAPAELLSAARAGRRRESRQMNKRAGGPRRDKHGGGFLRAQRGRFMLLLAFAPPPHFTHTSDSHHLFYFSFNQFHFSLLTAHTTPPPKKKRTDSSNSAGVATATAVARQRTTPHLPFQKSDRWRENNEARVTEAERRRGGRRGRAARRTGVHDAIPIDSSMTLSADEAARHPQLSEPSASRFLPV